MDNAGDETPDRCGCELGRRRWGGRRAENNTVRTRRTANDFVTAQGWRFLRPGIEISRTDGRCARLKQTCLAYRSSR